MHHRLVMLCVNVSGEDVRFLMRRDYMGVHIGAHVTLVAPTLGSFR